MNPFLITNLHQQLFDLNVTVKDYGNYELYTYDQLKTPRDSELARHCRGSIVRKSDRKIVRRMFKRFFNLGQFPNEDALFDFESGLAESKEDGSIIGVWWDDFENTFQIGTNSTAYGDCSLHSILNVESDLTFAKLFKNTLQFSGSNFETFSSKLNKEYTYIFELCTLDNKVIRIYDKPTIYLLGCIHNETGIELNNTQLNDVATSLACVVRPYTYPLESFEQILDAANNLPNLEEGFVLKDKFNNRIKVKSVQYLAAHHIKGNNLTKKRALLLCINGEIDELLNYCPEYKDYITDLTTDIDNFCKTIYSDFQKYSHLIGNKKDFALAIKHLSYRNVLFTLYSYPEKSVKDILFNMSFASLENLLLENNILS